MAPFIFCGGIVGLFHSAIASSLSWGYSLWNMYSLATSYGGYCLIIDFSKNEICGIIVGVSGPVAQLVRARAS